jgi:hypothetical protein
MIKALIWGKPGLEGQAEGVYDASGPPTSRMLEKVTYLSLHLGPQTTLTGPSCNVWDLLMLNKQPQIQPWPMTTKNRTTSRPFWTPVSAMIQDCVWPRDLAMFEDLPHR